MPVCRMSSSSRGPTGRHRVTVSRSLCMSAYLSGRVFVIHHLLRCAIDRLPYSASPSAPETEPSGRLTHPPSSATLIIMTRSVKHVSSAKNASSDPSLNGREEVIVSATQKPLELNSGRTGRALIAAMQAIPHPDVDARRKGDRCRNTAAKRLPSARGGQNGRRNRRPAPPSTRCAPRPGSGRASGRAR
jgi:hypothetical protein